MFERTAHTCLNALRRFGSARRGAVTIDIALPKRALAQLRRLAADTGANFAVTTALCAVPMFGMMGLAIDYSILLSHKTRLDAAADAAALAAATKTKIVLGGGGTVSAAIAAGQAQGAASFASNAGPNPPTPVVVVNPPTSDNIMTTSVSYTSTDNLFFGKIFATATAGISGNSAASLALPSYINIYLMLDTSGSMAIGASSADQQTLMQRTGCAFACHDGAPVGGYTDAYTFAEAIGIQLRYDVINAGVRKFLSQVDVTDPQHQYIKANLYSFDSSLHNLTGSSSPTSNTIQLKANLPTAPATSGDYDGATHFNESIASVMNDIGSGGNGQSAAAPKKLLIIATDGVQDPNRTWTSNLSLRPQVTAIDTGFCQILHTKNVTVAFIHMPYLPMAWDWGYVATLGQPVSGTSQTRVDLVQPALQTCAGKFYSLANDTTSLTAAFANIFHAFVGSRLTQ